MTVVVAAAAVQAAGGGGGGGCDVTGRAGGLAGGHLSLEYADLTSLPSVPAIFTRLHRLSIYFRALSFRPS